MELVCLDQRFNRKLVFPKQRVSLVNRENDQEIDLKKTLEINEALGYTLADCVLFTSNDDTEMMLGVFGKNTSELKVALTAEIKETQRINLSFLRKKSPAEEGEDQQNIGQNQSSAAAEVVGLESQIVIPILTRKRKSEETTQDEATSSQSKKRKKLLSSSSGGQIAENNDPSIQGTYQQQHQHIQQGIQGSEEEEISPEKDEFDGDKAISKKSQERTIKDALEMVCKWRDLQDFYKANNITKDYQSVADEIGISKKTLDYYYLELRTAEYFGFDFDQNLKNKMGYLREFVTESKKIHSAKFSTNKIPRNSTLKYRIHGNFTDPITPKQPNANTENNPATSPYVLPFYDPVIYEQQQQKQMTQQQPAQLQHQLQRTSQQPQTSAYPQQPFQLIHQQQQQQQQVPPHMQQIPQQQQQRQKPQLASSSSQPISMMQQQQQCIQNPTQSSTTQQQELPQTTHQSSAGIRMPLQQYFSPPFQQDLYAPSALSPNQQLQYQQDQHLAPSQISQMFSSNGNTSQPQNIRTSVTQYSQ